MYTVVVQLILIKMGRFNKESIFNQACSQGTQSGLRDFQKEHSTEMDLERKADRN